jgi:hypothetical protein
MQNHTTRAYANACTHMPTYITHTHTQKFTQTRTFSHTDTNMLTHTHIRTHIHARAREAHLLAVVLLVAAELGGKLRQARLEPARHHRAHAALGAGGRRVTSAGRGRCAAVETKQGAPAPARTVRSRFDGPRGIRWCPPPGAAAGCRRVLFRRGGAAALTLQRCPTSFPNACASSPFMPRGLDVFTSAS